MNRRNFLKTTSCAVIGVSLVPLTGCEMNFVDPIVTGSDIPFLTPVQDFFVKQGAQISISNWQQPEISQNEWRLRIDGLVSNPITLTFNDLLDATNQGNEISILKTLRCVIDSNEIQGLIGTAVWSGIPLSYFLSQVGIDLISTKRLFLYGSDGFTNNIKLARALGPFENQIYEPLLVTKMNGEALPTKFGGPVRMILNETFGFKNVKWIERIEATAQDIPFGTYQDAGFEDEGIIKITSRATNPLNNAVIPAGPLVITGFAVAGNAPVQKVEVSIDNNAYIEATLEPIENALSTFPELGVADQISNNSFPAKGVWVKWSLPWNPAQGLHTLRIRATDAQDNVQPQTDTDISDSINATPLLNVQVV